MNGAAAKQLHMAMDLAKSKVDQLFCLMFQHHMNVYPSRRISRRRASKTQYDKDRSWVFFGSTAHMKSVATISTMLAYLNTPEQETTYYTPNSFYRNDQRREDTARWIHAFVVDIDVKGRYRHLLGIRPMDVLDRIEAAGLPKPTAIVQTPSGGMQPIWVLSQPIRATEKARSLYKAIQRHMVEELDGDLQAVGVQNIYRTPSEESLHFFERTNTYDFQCFIDWRDINHPLEEVSSYWGAVKSTDIMRYPALRKLFLQTAQIGERDNTCVTLALAMKYSGWEEDRAYAEITNWHDSRVDVGYGKNAFKLNKALDIVRRMYASNRLNAPSPKYIESLTGIPFSFDQVRYYRKAKSRADRQRSHLSESKADLIAYVQKERLLTGSLKSIASLLKMPVSTLKIVVQQAKQEGKIQIKTVRGRNGGTRIEWIEPIDSPDQKTTNHKPEENKKIIHVDFKEGKRIKKENQMEFEFNEIYQSTDKQNSHTGNTIDRVVGWQSHSPPV
jgi:hypothetical protein